MSTVNGGYPHAGFARLAELENGHYWFESRNQLIVWAVRRYFPDMRTLLEVGCGTGFVLQALHAAFPDARLIASDFLPGGLAVARQRVPSASFREEDARTFDVTTPVDVACLFDVLEHIDEDIDVLNRLSTVVAPGGGLLITVPQHPALWSPADEQAKHVRRYRRRDLITKVRDAGFQIHRVTSFVSLLLPILVASRWLQRRGSRAVGTNGVEFHVPPLGNALLRAVLTLESASIRCGVSWPVGGSLLVVARKPTTSGVLA